MKMKVKFNWDGFGQLKMKVKFKIVSASMKSKFIWISMQDPCQPRIGGVRVRSTLSPWEPLRAPVRDRRLQAGGTTPEPSEGGHRRNGQFLSANFLYRYSVSGNYRANQNGHILSLARFLHGTGKH